MLTVIMEQKETISEWITQRKYRGKYTFCVEDVMKDFPALQYSNVFNSLNRQVNAKTIISPARGFYVIVPTEYGLKGLVPPVFYIDQMMAYLKRKYYIGLLNAAEFYGAALQRPQSMTVIHTPPRIIDGIRAGERFHFIKRNRIHPKFVETRTSRLGTVNISSAELTALDLIANEKKVGGLNRVCTVLNDLADSLDTAKFDEDFYDLYPAPIYQRLGYILENILEEDDLANQLFEKLSLSEMRLRVIPFKIGKSTDGCDASNRWKVIENQEIEIDE